jgi:hypothetical protein
MSHNPLLPIVTPDPVRKTNVEKYGGLYYLSIAGLTILLGMIIWFSASVWSMGTIWADVYAVTDSQRTELDRINAAWRLAHDPRTTDRQKWDLAMNRVVPPLGRYLLAESLSAEATSSDPRGYALAATKSEGWPSWLRCLVARPLAYAAASGRPLNRSSVIELAGHRERFTARWAEFALSQDDTAKAHEWLAATSDADRTFLERLRLASTLTQPRLSESLDETTIWLRESEPSAREVWNGWTETSNGIEPIRANATAPD